ncbi:hypothetical protein, partial [Burkholderia metallica]|uniref:hypothetical protein n=1 Tax=Burkholderia metallica TaxID=488729 RepID=UPI001C2DA529
CITNGISAAPDRSATRMRLAAQIEHLNYWTARYSTSARDLRADGDAAYCGLVLWWESAEWDIN